MMAHKNQVGSQRELGKSRMLRIYRLTVKKSLLKYGDMAKDALSQEIDQMIKKGVFEYIVFTKLNKAQRKNVIRSSVFMKEKYNTKGVFVKLKARLVAGGDQQDKSIYEDISSPTVRQESVMMVIAIAAAEDRKLVTCDVTGAFLEAMMPDDCEVSNSEKPYMVVYNRVNYGVTLYAVY